LLNHPEDAGIALQGSRVELNVVKDIVDPPQPMHRIFQRNTTDDAMNFITFAEQKLCEV
jgi:hypothetical protein